MLYEFEPGHNATLATKDICGIKDEDVVDNNTVTRRLKKFRTRCKNLDDWARSDWPKTVGCEALLQNIRANSVSSTRNLTVQCGLSPS